MTLFEYGFCATQGRRNYQEDAALVWPPRSPHNEAPEATFDWNVAPLPDVPSNGLVVVLADGMGGHAGGALASKTLCVSFIQNWVATLQQDPAHTGNGEDMPRRLQTALQAGNSSISNLVKADPALSGMGSTLIGAIFSDDGLEWISVGDSPLFLYRREEIALLNEDHSLAPALDRLAEEGKISKQQAQNDPRRHMLRSAIMGEDLELIDVSRKPLTVEPDDYIIAASDGVHTLDETELIRIIGAYRAYGPHKVAAAIVEAIDNACDPYQDNATVIAVKMAS